MESKNHGKLQGFGAFAQFSVESSVFMQAEHMEVEELMDEASFPSRGIHRLLLT